MAFQALAQLGERGGSGELRIKSHSASVLMR